MLGYYRDIFVDDGAHHDLCIRFKVLRHRWFFRRYSAAMSIRRKRLKKRYLVSGPPAQVHGNTDNVRSVGHVCIRSPPMSACRASAPHQETARWLRYWHFYFEVSYSVWGLHYQYVVILYSQRYRGPVAECAYKNAPVSLSSVVPLLYKGKYLIDLKGQHLDVFSFARRCGSLSID